MSTGRSTFLSARTMARLSQFFGSRVGDFGAFVAAAPIGIPQSSSIGFVNPP